ncbi:hypothetical protein Pan216_00630 [Planctomycetes bacterium Pan216]|uniref:SLA1 homology domain-containing protein n=1 Tax=Kolteria novifilia TaxID=2527975 RepID=A0A518AWZ9_9BACT|nr:hypothetical protein Pan216_00630 [Planctomycetes bacterium Pan216]
MITLLAIFLVSTWSGPANAEDSYRSIQPGDRYSVRSRSTLKGTLSLPPTKEGDAPRRLEVNGTATVRYRERPLEVNDQGRIDRVLRLYDGVKYERTVGDQQQEAGLRDDVKRVVLVRRNGRDIPYSPDAPLSWTEIDLLQTHVLVPVLERFLPKGSFAKGSTWDVPKEAVLELTGLDALESGTLHCTHHGVIDLSGRALEQIGFEGTLLGKTEDGQVRDLIRGGVYLDEKTRRLQSIRALGTRQLLDRDRKVVGELEVDYGLILTPLEDDPELTDKVVAAIPGPTDELTALLYEHPGLGGRVLHPRHWLLTSAVDRQMTFESHGNALVIHWEKDGETPSGKQYREDILKHLADTNVKVTASTPVSKSTAKSGELETFRIDAVEKGTPTVLAYGVLRSGKRGVTLAGRFRAEDASRLGGDLLAFARGIEFFQPAQPIGPESNPSGGLTDPRGALPKRGP